MPAWLRPALAVILALVFAAVAIDPVRAAIGDLLGIAGGERVVRSERVGTGAPLALGERVNLDEARARAGFDPLVPGRLGPPREVRFGGDLGDRAVSLVYDDTVLTEIPDASAIFAIKRIAASVQVTWTPLGDAQAAWIDRGPRVLVIPHADSGRPAARRSALPGAGVLLWDRQGVAMRLETRRGRAEALAIARSLRRPQ